MLPKILSNFYSCIVESILTSCITLTKHTDYNERPKLERPRQRDREIDREGLPLHVGLARRHGLRAGRRQVSPEVREGQDAETGDGPGEGRRGPVQLRVVVRDARTVGGQQPVHQAALVFLLHTEVEENRSGGGKPPRQMRMMMMRMMGRMRMMMKKSSPRAQSLTPVPGRDLIISTTSLKINGGEGCGGASCAVGQWLIFACRVRPILT
ncbi:hypothetical protein N1851_032734 [Merluccius polli]|uniref:Uncharacterized protein n=1 Tax=Merluccius polli TaxID=89951 RepID=A0AA47NP86_MERPO|nr:hypothetical protein N1851_032734 [Merluccius polli]